MNRRVRKVVDNFRTGAVVLCGAGCLCVAGCGGGGGDTGQTAGSVAGAGSGSTVVQGRGTLAWSTTTSAWPRMAAAAVVLVARTGGSDGVVSASYATRDGSAVAGRDYTAASGTLTWGDKDASPRSVTVLLGSTTAATGQPGFDVVLTSATGGVAFDPANRTTVTLDDALLAPASLSQFDFSKWKLDLPVDRNGGTGGAGGIEIAAQTITSAQLLRSFADPYFYADKQGRLIFTAPANGAVTSPGSGSDHTRSELREVFSGPGADVNGNWTGSGRLTGTCQVRAVAASSGTTIISQLRGQAHDLALLVYRAATHDVAVDIYSTNTTGSTHTLTPLATNVNLGDTITYTLALNGSLLSATVNGASRSVTVDSSWVGAPLYFKLGAYSAAPNTGNAAADVTMVAYSAFAVTH